MQASKEEQQKVFEDVFLSLWKQGKKSMNGSFGCAYRGDDGCKCAIGFLIQDYEYKEVFEGFGIADLRDNFHPIRSLEKYSTDFLYALQKMHDSIYDGEWVNFKDCLIDNAKRFATKWKLQMPEVPSETPNG